MLLPNNTHYYSPHTRTYNNVPDPDSFASQSSKRVSYQQRLYFEALDTSRCDGQAFFYTTTYNDSAIPYFDLEDISIPCFSYDDIRLVTNGLITKTLNRKYGSTLRYFCCCEYGEGGSTHNYKGVRGAGRNPHLHWIFFVSPLRDENNNPIFDNYKKISARGFRNLVKKVWQYRRDPDTKEIYLCDWKQARFGHVQEGNNNGVIDLPKYDSSGKLTVSPDCFSYVSKYVTKDNVCLGYEKQVLAYFEREINSRFITLHTLLEYYKQLKENMSSYNRNTLLIDSGLIDYNHWRKKTHFKDKSYENYIRTYRPDIMQDFIPGLENFFKSYAKKTVADLFRNYKNKYSAKVRTSKSLGIFGLQFVKDVDSNPHFVLPSSTLQKVQKPALYYFRKLYYDTVKCPVTENILYVLNDRGINLKSSQLSETVNRYYNNLKSSYSFVCNPLNAPSVRLHNNSVFSLEQLTKFKPLSDDELYKLSVYNIVYRYRHYIPNDSFPIHLNDHFVFDDIMKDYRSFLRNTMYELDYDDMSINRRYSSVPVHSFATHSVFKPIVFHIHRYDAILDIFNSYNSARFKSDFERISSVSKLINTDKFNHKIH